MKINFSCSPTGELGLIKSQGASYPGKKAFLREPVSEPKQPLPVKAEREAEREAGEKALWALVSLGWLWLQDRHQDRQKKKNMRGE